MNYNFIEIGTSNFDTLAQRATDEHVGLSVEPVKEYLEELPQKKHVTKVNCAISNEDRTGKLYHITSENIKKFVRENSLEFRKYAYIQGCNCIDSPHPAQLKVVKRFDLHPNIITVTPVEIISFRTLINRYSVESVGLIKIDAEGHDATILKSYLEACEKDGAPYAPRIVFEINPLSDKDESLRVIKEFSKHGYTASGSWGDVMLTRKA